MILTRTVIIRSFLLLLALLSYGCTEKKYLTQTSPDDVLFEGDDSSKESMLEALDRQIDVFMRVAKRKKAAAWFAGEEKYTTKQMLLSTKKFREIFISSKDTKNLKQQLAKYFDFYSFKGRDGEKVLITGYYSPVLKARFKKTSSFKFPVYGLPDDLLRLDLSKFAIGLSKSLVARVDERKKQILPYYTREDIDWGGALSGRGHEIAYLDSYWDQFFLHIQGGGILEIPDKGKEKRIFLNYAGKNGKAYTSIGRLLIDDNKISKDKLSLQAIRDYFKANPGDLKKYAIKNQSYVFYSVGKEGPYGSLGAVVTPKRTIATDKKIFSGGFLAFIRGKYRTGGQRKFNRFVISQDIGGAIKKNHIDLYCGLGKEGENIAGYLKERGDVVFLLPKKNLFTSSEK